MTHFWILAAKATIVVFWIGELGELFEVLRARRQAKANRPSISPPEW